MTSYAITAAGEEYEVVPGNAKEMHTYQDYINSGFNDNHDNENISVTDTLTPEPYQDLDNKSQERMHYYQPLVQSKVGVAVAGSHASEVYEDINTGENNAKSSKSVGMDVQKEKQHSHLPGARTYENV